MLTILSLAKLLILWNDIQGNFLPGASRLPINLGRVYRTEPGKYPFFFGNWLTAIYENSTNLSSLFCAFAHKKDTCCWGKAPLVISSNSWVLVKDFVKNFQLILFSCEFWKIENYLVILWCKVSILFMTGLLCLSWRDFVKGMILPSSKVSSLEILYQINLLCFSQALFFYVLSKTFSFTYSMNAKALRGYFPKISFQQHNACDLMKQDLFSINRFIVILHTIDIRI